LVERIYSILLTKKVLEIFFLLPKMVNNQIDTYYFLSRAAEGLALRCPATPGNGKVPNPAEPKGSGR
jgi:hypothetical protein